MFTLVSLFATTATASYRLIEDMSGSSFFNHWNFMTFNSPTHGYSKYSPQSSGLGVVENGVAYLRVDTTQTVYSPRKTLRLHSKNTYEEGLFIMDAAHMPEGCSVWPAWWFDGPNWPYGGEIDVIEYVNTGVHNHATLHTSPGCTINPNESPFTGNMGQRDCNAKINGNAGCGIKSNDGQTCGSGFNQVGGGVIAMEYIKNRSIKVWNFHRNNIPRDIKAGVPNPSGWGTPTAAFTLGTSCPGNKFARQTMILNTELCGDWAGASGVWRNQYHCDSQTGHSNCVDQVKYNGSAYRKAYWAINYIKIYQSGSHPGPSPNPGPTPTPPSPSPGSAACSAHRACAHLWGNCCPTNDGVTLDCCRQGENPGNSTTVIPDTNSTVIPERNATATPIFTTDVPEKVGPVNKTALA